MQYVVVDEVQGNQYQARMRVFKDGEYNILGGRACNTIGDAVWSLFEHHGKEIGIELIMMIIPKVKET
jgi:hypothetical protein